MKLTNALFTLLLIVVLGCQNNTNQSKSEETSTPVDEVSTPTETTTISKDTFDVWKARWDDNFRTYFAEDSLHYFDLPIVDLSDILGEDPVDNARLYMGMDYMNIPHIMMVGTSDNVPNFELIVDYSNACPPKCGE